MGALMDDLLGFSRLLRQPLHTSRIEPAAIVRRVIEEGAGMAQGRDIAFAIGALPRVRGRPGAGDARVRRADRQRRQVHGQGPGRAH